MVIVLMLSVVSIAPVSYIINQQTKDNAQTPCGKPSRAPSLSFARASFTRRLAKAGGSGASVEDYPRGKISSRGSFNSSRETSTGRSGCENASGCPGVRRSRCSNRAPGDFKTRIREGDQDQITVGNFDMQMRLDLRGIRSLYRHKNVLDILGVTMIARNRTKLLSRPTGDFDS